MFWRLMIKEAKGIIIISVSEDEEEEDLVLRVKFRYL